MVTPKDNVTICYVTLKNKHKRKYSSEFKNILFRKDRNKYIVQIKINGKRKCIGSYYTELEALNRYNEYYEIR